MASDCRRCSCSRRPDPRSPCIRCWHGVLGRIPVGQFRHIGKHIPNYHRPLSDRGRAARLCHGGYVAGRLRTRWVGVHTHEVFFRDTAHGFLAWAFATVIGAGFLAAAASNIAGGASPGLAPAANVSVTAGSGSPLDYYVDALLRPNPAASPNATDPGAARREIAGILTKGIADGDVAGPDRTYMAQVIAARTGLSQADADKRVSNVIDQAKTDLDTARKAAAKLSLWLTAALLFGAFAASLAATQGGKVRDFNASLTDG